MHMHMDMDYLAGEDAMLSQRGSDLSRDRVNPIELLGHIQYVTLHIAHASIVVCN